MYGAMNKTRHRKARELDLLSQRKGVCSEARAPQPKAHGLSNRKHCFADQSGMRDMVLDMI